MTNDLQYKAFYDCKIIQYSNKLECLSLSATTTLLLIFSGKVDHKGQPSGRLHPYSQILD
jgi:hypothetical protein